MINEHTPSKDSLDLINDAIIRETFITGTTITGSIKLNKETEEDGCCDDNCFKWWFFHSSFQVPKQSVIEQDLINKPNKYSCCNVCGDCIELKVKNCCIITNDCMKQHCSDCFYNGCQLTCCCFTFILSSR
jgi:hypothetical protein